MWHRPNRSKIFYLLPVFLQHIFCIDLLGHTTAFHKMWSVKLPPRDRTAPLNWLINVFSNLPLNVWKSTTGCLENLFAAINCQTGGAGLQSEIGVPMRVTAAATILAKINDRLCIWVSWILRADLCKNAPRTYLHQADLGNRNLIARTATTEFPFDF